MKPRPAEAMASALTVCSLRKPREHFIYIRVRRACPHLQEASALGPICLWPGTRSGFGAEERDGKSGQVTAFEKPALGGTYEAVVVWRKPLLPQTPWTVSPGPDGAGYGPDLRAPRNRGGAEMQPEQNKPESEGISRGGGGSLGWSAALPMGPSCSILR